MTKIAAIDIGTNSFHLIIVEIKKNGNFKIIDREKEVIRLGKGNKGDIKKISEDAIIRASDTIKRFKGIADSHNAEVHAVATSAVREAFNKNEFIERIKMETGVETEVISGEEEARLIYLGILKAVPVYDKRTLCIDIGGGSTELMIGYKGKILYSASIKLGAVRLTQMFFPDYKITESRLDNCLKWIKGELFNILKKINDIGFEIAVGSSGTIMSIGFMVLTQKSKDVDDSAILNNFEFSNDKLEKVVKKVFQNKTLVERQLIRGLDEKRADIIPAGILILKTIFEQLKLKNILVSGYALREGLIIDTIQKISPSGESPNLHDIRFESVNQLADSCNYDKIHCQHVAKLALHLFDQLKELHHLNDVYHEYLDAAARLHDIGYHISRNQHHHHSFYIINHSDLLGFNQKEIKIIANIARYHRKSHPKSIHKDFDSLPGEAQEIVKKLASILRIADSLDRTHSDRIKLIEAELEDKIVKLNVFYKGKLPEIEIWNFNRRKKMFEEVFNRKIKLNTIKK